MEKLRVYADFNKGTRERGEYWLFLTRQQTFDEMKRLHIEPHVGLQLSFYMTEVDTVGQVREIEAEGIIRYAISHGWIAVIDEATIRHSPVEQ